MGKYAQWITHKGKRILFVNLAGLKEAEYIAGLEEMKQVLLEDRSAPPLLTDMSKTRCTIATVKKAKEVDGAIKNATIGYGPHSIVGLNMLQKTIVDLSTRHAFYTDSIQEAKDWLVEQDDKRHRCQTASLRG
jgi:hypothetical protein